MNFNEKLFISRTENILFISFFTISMFGFSSLPVTDCQLNSKKMIIEVSKPMVLHTLQFYVISKNVTYFLSCIFRLKEKTRQHNLKSNELLQSKKIKFLTAAIALKWLGSSSKLSENSLEHIYNLSPRQNSRKFFGSY